MELTFAPRKQLVAMLMDGWSPLVNYDYQPGEYALLLKRDGTERTEGVAQFVADQICVPAPNIIGVPKANKGWRRLGRDIEDAVLRQLATKRPHALIARSVGISRCSVSHIRNSDRGRRILAEAGA